MFLNYLYYNTKLKKEKSKKNFEQKILTSELVYCLLISMLKKFQ